MRYYQVARTIDAAVTRTMPKVLLPILGDYQFPYYHMMYLLAKYCKVAVELGVEKGRGCASLALGNPYCEVYGLDHTARVEALELAARLYNFHFLEAASMPMPPDIPDGIDFLHIDTEHSISMALGEFNTYKPKLNPGAVVCFDDTHAMENSVLEGLVTLPYPIILDDRLHPVCGYGVLYYVGDVK